MDAKFILKEKYASGVCPDPTIEDVFENNDFSLVEKVSTLSVKELIPYVVGVTVAEKIKDSRIMRILENYVGNFQKAHKERLQTVLTKYTQTMPRARDDTINKLFLKHTAYVSGIGTIKHDMLARWMLPISGAKSRSILHYVVERLENWKVGEKLFNFDENVVPLSFEFFVTYHLPDFNMLKGSKRDEIVSGMCWNCMHFTLLYVVHLFRIQLGVVIHADGTTDLFRRDPDSVTIRRVIREAPLVEPKDLHKKQKPKEAVPKKIAVATPEPPRKIEKEKVKDVPATPAPKTSNNSSVVTTPSVSEKESRKRSMDSPANFDLSKVKREKLEIPTFDLSKVKKEKSNTTEKVVTATPPVVSKPSSNHGSQADDRMSEKSDSDITRDLIDFARFKTDIDADPNIQAVYKTIFGLIIDNREILKERFLELQKENVRLRGLLRNNGIEP